MFWVINTHECLDIEIFEVLGLGWKLSIVRRPAEQFHLKIYKA